MTGHLTELIERAMADHASRPALMGPDGTSLSYADLERRSAEMAARLSQRGAKPGDRVAVVVPKSVDSVVALLGVLRAGGVCVPIDPSAPPRRHRMILESAAPAVVAMTRAAWSAVREAGYVAEQATLLVEPGEQAGTTEEAQPFHGSESPRSSDDLAYILFTSGSTGVPKGVALSHANVRSFVDWCESTFSPAPSDHFVSIAPFHFDLSVHDLYSAIGSGALLHIADEATTVNPKRLVNFISAANATVVYATPSVFTLLLEHGGLEAAAIRSVRRVLFAGEVFPIRPLRRLAAVWPQAEFYNLYGPTETNVCTFARVETPIPDDRTEPWPIGAVCSHCEGIVLGDGGEPVATGEHGRLCIAGASVFRGYWGRPDLDAKAFIERDGKRWYDTGDVVYETPGGGYVYVGRRDRMVKRRGYRIELGEIERAVEAADSVHATAVVANEDEKGGVRITAFVVGHAAARPSVLSLRSACASALPAYMIPDTFVVVPELPRTSTDKIDYQTLRSRAARPAG